MGCGAGYRAIHRGTRRHTGHIFGAVAHRSDRVRYATRRFFRREPGADRVHRLRDICSGRGRLQPAAGGRCRPHWPAGGGITVGLAQEAGTPVLSVADTGPGIPAPEREKVFRRFYRLEAHRTTPGSGLGLALVKAVAELHGASVELSDNHPGLRVTVRFSAAGDAGARTHPAREAAELIHGAATRRCGDALLLVRVAREDDDELLGRHSRYRSARAAPVITGRGPVSSV
ncbi:MAG: sensor histidine kinase [Betaproteobacteria bacterium]|nr:sensor histidine kinase [Betaproteobacteria bacterium]